MLFSHCRPIKKYLLVFIFLLVLGGIVLVSLYYFSPSGKQARKYTKGLGILQQKIQDREAQFQNDKYGGKTPEGTYQLFLDALKKNNIDLASKYFVFDKQEQYKQLLLSIQKNKEWKEMLMDLSNSLHNKRGKYQDRNNYLIEVINENNNLVTTIHLTASTSSLWKITEF